LVFVAAALLMTWDFMLKLRPFYPRLLRRRREVTAKDPASAAIGMAARDAH